MSSTQKYIITGKVNVLGHVPNFNINNSNFISICATNIE
jgi:hypothetical protein